MNEHEPRLPETHCPRCGAALLYPERFARAIAEEAYALGAAHWPAGALLLAMLLGAGCGAALVFGLVHFGWAW